MKDETIKYIGKYFGGKKIKLVKVDGKKKTWSGKDVYYILFTDKSFQYLPSQLIDSMTTKKPIDATALMNLKAKPIIEQILAIITEADLKFIDVEYVFQVATQSINESLERANEKLWGKQKIDRTMMDIDIVLKSK